jgi:murein DD-endopeptidase MepM/ murein hydrolase activator NlpD
VIAAIGMTGVTTGPHVHWELKVNGVAVNPLAY